MANEMHTTAETNLITTEQMVRAREIDFVNRFGNFSLKALNTALGVTRKIAMQEGTTLYAYKTTGTLQNGSVGEGEVIPLSQYAREKTQIGNITLNKWRKATSAEAIMKSGYQEAVNETDKKMIQDIQKSIRDAFFNFLKSVDGTVVGASTLQMVLAKTWANLQILFENDTVEAVHFINPLTIADYLGAASISMQTAFGMNYIEDFLGLGTVIMSSQIPQGKVYSTAKENLILYYLPMNGQVADAFTLTSDETGLIGTHIKQTDERMQIERIAASGIQYLVEYASGVVIGQVDSTPTLGEITVTSTAGTASGDSNIAVSGYTLGEGEKYVYKTGASAAPTVTYGQKLKNWTDITPPHDITPGTATKITVAAVDSEGRAQAAGNATITKNT